MITLTLKDHTYRRVVAVIEAAVPNAANHHATTWWTTLQMEYGTISPTQVFDLIRTSPLSVSTLPLALHMGYPIA